MTNSTNPDLLAQAAYAQRMVEEGFDFGLTHTQAFVRGIRDLGYKNTGTALDELIDNADQADAKHVHVFWEDVAKPSWIAIADDGHGMVADMIRLAVVWGGTHREDDRDGFGRYGYGLPSASVSIGRRFTTFSKVVGGGSQAVTIDLDDMENGVYSQGHKIVIPEPDSAAIPKHVMAQARKDPAAAKAIFGEHGTVVLIEKVDRLSWKTTTGLKRNLLEHFGLFYRNYLRSLDIFVQGDRVLPVDPLFLMENGRFYDLDDDRAEALPPQILKVKTETHGIVEINVRYSYMPPRFLGVDKDKERGKNNERFPIRADNNGLIILRNHRQIDVVPAKRGLVSFNNDDRYVGVELDFPASLDEEFSITTSKQQVALSDRIWDILKAEGVFQAIAQMRRRYDEDKKRLRKKRNEKANEPKVPEKVMAETEKYSKQSAADKAAQEQRGEENLKRRAKMRAELTGKSVDEAADEMRAQAKVRPFRIEEEDLRGAPFFRVEQVGGQKTIFLNRLHEFYLKLYKGQDTTDRVRDGLALMLLVVGNCELEAATEERQRFYVQERQEWSSRLDVALAALDSYLPEDSGPPDDESAGEAA